MASSRQRSFDSWLNKGFLFPSHEVEVRVVDGVQKMTEKLVFACPVCPNNPVVTDFQRPAIDRGNTHLKSASHRINLQASDGPRISTSKEAVLPPGRLFLGEIEKEAYLRQKMGFAPVETHTGKITEKLNADVLNLQTVQSSLEGRQDMLESGLERHELEMNEIRQRFRHLSAEVKESKEECIVEVNFNREMLVALDEHLYEAKGAVEELKCQYEEMQDQILRPLANSTELETMKEATRDYPTASNANEEEDE